MTATDALNIINAAVDQVNVAGFVVTGELHMCIPKTPGLVKQLAYGRVGDVTEYRVATSKIQDHPLPHLRLIPLEGEICIRCGGSRFQRTGTCKTCLDCGESAGCG